MASAVQSVTRFPNRKAHREADSAMGIAKPAAGVCGRDMESWRESRTCVESAGVKARQAQWAGSFGHRCLPAKSTRDAEDGSYNGRRIFRWQGVAGAQGMH